MKKLLLISYGVLAVAATATAQKSKIRTANEYLTDNPPNYNKAIAAIDEAVANDDTKNNPDAWLMRGRAYLTKSFDTTLKSPDADDIAYNSFVKALELKPGYDSAEINNLLYSNAISFFNRGVVAYGAKDYVGAYNNFIKVDKIYSINGGTRFARTRSFTDLDNSAKSNAAYAALNAKNYEQATPLLESLKNTQSPKDSNVYQSLVEIYVQQNNTDKLGAILTDARHVFPGNRYFRDQELNYYIKAGRQDILMTKLEDALAQDPNNPELLFNLANGYQAGAFPLDAKGKALPMTAANIAAYDKAEATYLKAIKTNPDNATYNYNTAIIYYKRATVLNQEMMDITGNAPADNKHSEDLLKTRNEYFDKALPYFEKAYTILDANKSSLNADDKSTYINTMIGLSEIYSRKKNKVKADEFSAKIKAAR